MRREWTWAPLAKRTFRISYLAVRFLVHPERVRIVESGDDAIILHKLSGLLGAAGKERRSDRVYMRPAHCAFKTAIYAGFAIGQECDARVLLDTDEAGHKAKAKIDELYVSNLAEEKKRFRTFMLGKAVGSKKTDVAIADLSPKKFYLDCVDAADDLAIKMEALPADGSDMITKRVEPVLKTRYAMWALDKRRMLGEMWNRFDTWQSAADLTGNTASNAEKLFKAINAAFGKEPEASWPSDAAEREAPWQNAIPRQRSAASATFEPLRPAR